MINQELEPEAENLLKAGKTGVDHMSELPALYSIAISLKRIADVMTYVPVLNTEGLDEDFVATEMAKPGFFINR